MSGARQLGPRPTAAWPPSRRPEGRPELKKTVSVDRPAPRGGRSFSHRNTMNIGALFAADSGLGAGPRQGALLGVAVLVLTLPPAAAGRWATANSPNAGQIALACHCRPTSSRMLHPAMPALWPTGVNTSRVQPAHALRHVSDKRDAKIFALNARCGARVLGAAPATTACIGHRPVRPGQAERNHGGRSFRSPPGRNAGGGGGSTTTRRCRCTACGRSTPKKRRLERLASNAAGRSAAFPTAASTWPGLALLQRVVHPLMGKGRGVVYVLPETLLVQVQFGADRTRREQPLNGAPSAAWRGSCAAPLHRPGPRGATAVHR